MLANLPAPGDTALVTMSEENYESNENSANKLFFRKPLSQVSERFKESSLV